MYEISGRLTEENFQSIVRFLESYALYFYLQAFTDSDELTAEFQDFDIAKKDMVEHYSKSKTEAKIIRATVDFCYYSGDVQAILRDADKLHNDLVLTKFSTKII